MADAGNSSLAAIFRRGGSKTELFDGQPVPDKQELNQQLQQLAVAWAIPKAKKGLAAAVWRPLVGSFEVIEKGRQHFNGQGFMHNKKLYLNVEEAVFMMDQAELLLLADTEDGQQLLSMQEAVHMMVSLGISHDRLQVLAHLSRLGYHVRRHPACWYAPAEQPAPTSWQGNPAWSNTDGLLAPQQHITAAPAMADLASSKHQEAEQAKKKRKVAQLPAEARAGAAAAVAEKEQKEQVAAGCMGWWDKLPYWLAHGENTTAIEAAAAASHGGACTCTAPTARSTPEDSDGVQHRVSSGPDEFQLLGAQLQQRFPDLKPLPTYTGLLLQPQPHHECNHVQQYVQQHSTCDHQQLQQRPRQDLAPRRAATAALVYDVIPCAAHFSYRCPPNPMMSFAMMAEECDCLPCLDELLQLSAAAADGTLGCTAGQQAAAQATVATPTRPEAATGAWAAKLSSLLVAMPDGSDVNYYELRPISLMNTLTN